jgi:hypothetical protein
MTLYLAAGEDAVGAFHELVSLLLSNTILGIPFVPLGGGPAGRPNSHLIGGYQPNRTLRLRNERFLRLAIVVYVAPPGGVAALLGRPIAPPRTASTSGVELAHVACVSW